MNAEPAFGGGVFIADKSVWARADQASLQEEWARALRNGQIATCRVNSIELLYSARSGKEFAELEEELTALRNFPTTDSVCRAAVTALRELASVSDGFHRVKPPDALIAACAQEAGVGVLHYDHDFDRLATVMNFTSRWIASAGTLDRDPDRRA
ncbi:MAG TPA: PIN domain-containing protein [Gaiellaceae bacterium]|nr:PIN domain-containing protein [Gaiellaceae bacterium]